MGFHSIPQGQGAGIWEFDDCYLFHHWTQGNPGQAYMKYSDKSRMLAVPYAEFCI